MQKKKNQLQTPQNSIPFIATRPVLKHAMRNKFSLPKQASYIPQRPCVIVAFVRHYESKWHLLQCKFLLESQAVVEHVECHWAEQ